MVERVEDVMQRDLVVAGPEASVSEAAKRMSERNVGSILVVKDGRLVGIFTERDLLRLVADERDPASTRLEDVMTRELVVARPGEELSNVICKMVRHNIRHIPVVDEEGTPLGIISMRDLVRLEALEESLCGS